MIRLLADENFHGDVLRGILRVEPRSDVVRVQDTPFYRATAPVIVAWVTEEDRILLTHHVQTITKYAYDGIRAGLPWSAVIEARDDVPTGQAMKKSCPCSAPANRVNSPTASRLFRFADTASWLHPELPRQSTLRCPTRTCATVAW